MTSVRELQRKYGFLFKGYLGQNFLIMIFCLMKY